MAGILGKAEIFTDGKRDMVLITMTPVVPTTQNISQLYDIIDYLPTLNKQFTIYIDLRAAKLTQYASYLPAFLRKMNSLSGNCVTSSELWFQKSVFNTPLIALLQHSIDTMMNTTKISIAYK